MDKSSQGHGPSDGCGRKGRGYHHGRLREALLAAARALISERGLGDFTLSELAKRVGVTNGAPYRHFADRRALIVELAERGFLAFNAELGRAWDNGRPDALTALCRRGKAYLDFARAEPGLYRAMFGEAGVLAPDAPKNAAKIAFDELTRTAVALLRQFCAPEREAGALALQIWATTHGVADLMLAGHFGEGTAQAEMLLERAVGAEIEAAVRRALGARSAFDPPA